MQKSKHIDFLSKETYKKDQIQQFCRPSKSFFTAKKIIPIMIVFVLFLAFTYTTRAVISSDTISEQFGNVSVVEQLKHLASAEDRMIQGQEQGRINILLLGIGGENHEGGNLTDTIIVASIDNKNNKLGMLSIPRDLVVPIEGVGWQKINAAHAYGIALDKNKKPQSGSTLATKTIESVTNLPIHYYIKIDFDGFVKIINALGGIRVEVPASFTDYEYPDENYGYEPVHFDAGWQNLSGDEALKYVRSRHGTSGEGSDFARALRQQQIIAALQARVLAMSTLLNPNKILAIADIIGKHVETNMQIWELMRLYDISKSVDLQNINHIVLDTSKSGLLVVDQNEEGTYLLRPSLGATDFSQIQQTAQNLVSENIQTNPIKTTEKNIETKLKVAIQNGTDHEGLAAQTADKIRNLSIVISDISNASQKGYEKTVIYALSENAMEQAQKIREILNANISPTIPEFLKKENVDVIIIVGEDNV